MEQTKQKSLFWVITTFYLTMILSGLILGGVMVSIAGFIFSGLSIVLSMVSAVIIEIILRIIGYIFGIKIAVGFISKRTVLKKENASKTSAIVAILSIVLYLLVGFFYKGITWIEIIAITLTAIIIYFASKYFLSKKAI